MRACMDALADAFRAYSSGKSVQPLRTMMKVPATDDILASMPGYDGASQSLAVKLITVFHDAAEAIEITAVRTAAASGVATEALANEDASTLAILGAGVQARSHFYAMNEARHIESVRIWNRSRHGAEVLAVQLSQRGGSAVTVTDTAEAAVSGADLICTVTAASEPILKGEWIQPGAHVNAVGSRKAPWEMIISSARSENSFPGKSGGDRTGTRLRSSSPSAWPSKMWRRPT